MPRKREPAPQDFEAIAMARPNCRLTEETRTTNARYIKLGEGGKWEDLCFEEGPLRLAFYEAPHELAVSADRTGLMAAFPGRSKATQASFAGQVLAFYQEPEDTLWITFAHGHLYWCRAKSGVEFFGQDKEKHPDGSRLRRTIGGWSRADIHGKPLRIAEMGGRIPSIARYQGTICSVGTVLKTILSLINGEDDPLVAHAKSKRDEAVASLQPLIARLSPRDLELLVELMFTQSGWRRLGETGGTQKTVDLDLEMPMTGERAMVQVKSRTSQQEFDDYIRQKDARGAARLFYIYHTAAKPLRSDRPDVSVFDLSALSEKTFSLGLFDWVVQKSR